MMPEKTVRILIVDDHALLREALALFVQDEDGLTVVGTAEDAETALRKTEQLAPDLLTLDLSLPGMGGLELVKQVKARFPDLRVLVVSMHEETTYAERCLKAGADGYIMKKEPPERVVAAIRKISRGEVAISPKISSQMLRRVAGTEPAETPGVLDALTDRELEVYELLGSGKSSREIAEQLNLSIKTIQYYREMIKQKLDLKDAAALIHSAYSWVQGLGIDHPGS